MKIAEVFNKNNKTLIGYIPVGYPQLHSTIELVSLLVDSGCDIIELGIPFSDPIGDGPVIQNACYLALQNSVTVAYCLETAAALKGKVNIPLVFMGYYNPILRYGITEFVAASARAGISGLIVPDLPPEEATSLAQACEENGLDLIYLITPTSTAERIKLAARKSSGFIYLVSTSGVTGVKKNLSSNLGSLVGRVRKYTDKPICVGFGIGSAKQAAEVSQLADGVIIGSRLIKLIEEDKSYRQLAAFVSTVKAAI